MKMRRRFVTFALAVSTVMYAAGTAPLHTTRTASAAQREQATCTRPVRFTKNLIDLDNVQVVTPLAGQTSFGGTLAVRSYVMPKSSKYGRALKLFAPTDMEITGASFYKPTGAPADYKAEYSLFFDLGCSVELQLYHVKGVSGVVAGVVPKTPSNSSASQQVKRTRIRAGQQIGWFTGEAGRSVAFDFRVEDRLRKNTFINQRRFEQSPSATGELYAVCPYNYYVEPLKSRWLAKLGSAGGTVVPGTSCGTLSQGTAGTAHGMWFLGSAKVNELRYQGTPFPDPAVGQAGQYQSQILFTNDADGTVRIGGLNVAAPLAQMMVGTNNATWKAPDTIAVGQTHCWSDSRQSVKVHVTAPATMTVAVGAGSCESLDLRTGKRYSR